MEDLERARLVGEIVKENVELGAEGKPNFVIMVAAEALHRAIAEEAQAEQERELRVRKCFLVVSGSPFYFLFYFIYFLVCGFVERQLGVPQFTTKSHLLSIKLIFHFGSFSFQFLAPDRQIGSCQTTLIYDKSFFTTWNRNCLVLCSVVNDMTFS